MMLNIRLRKARLNAGLTQAELARRLDVGRSAIANWERANNVYPCTFRLVEIAVITEVQHEWLSTGRGRMLYQQDVEETPAVDADIVYDPIERGLLHAFRASPARIRSQILELAKPFQIKKKTSKFL